MQALSSIMIDHAGYDEGHVNDDDNDGHGDGDKKGSPHSPKAQFS